MKTKYPHIFEPMTIRRMTVKNRIVMTPMGTNYGEQNGEMSFLHINYYEQRAKGGTGLLTLRTQAWILRRVPTERHSFASTLTIIFQDFSNCVRAYTNMEPVLRSRSIMQVLPQCLPVSECSRYPHLMCLPRQVAKSLDLWKRRDPPHCKKIR